MKQASYLVLLSVVVVSAILILFGINYFTENVKQTVVAILSKQLGDSSSRDKVSFSGTRDQKYYKNSKRTVEDYMHVDPDVQQLMQGFVEAKVQADHSDLVTLIREYFMDGPKTHMTKFSHHIYQTLQAKSVDKLLNQKKGGFFVDCGALDGERSSNSVWLEEKRKWTGLLVEMDPFFYIQMQAKNRKCYSINGCLSPESYPTILPFHESTGGHGRLETGGMKEASSLPDAYCFPFYSLMLALNRSHIDYFSLDVEGAEMSILRTIPFDKLDITIFTIEYSHQDSKQEMVKFMESKGYVMHERLSLNKAELTYYCDDYVFVKKGVLPGIP